MCAGKFVEFLRFDKAIHVLTATLIIHPTISEVAWDSRALDDRQTNEKLS